MFKMIPEKGCFFGYHGGDQLCFSYDKNGLSYTVLKEPGNTSAHKFVRCLSHNQLAHYINSSSEKVREAIQGRLQGLAAFDPIEHRQDIVDLYYRNILVAQRLLQSIEYIDLVIKKHMKALYRKLPMPLYSNTALTLLVNNRGYLSTGHDHTFTPPEATWSFTSEDLHSKDPVDAGHVYKTLLSLV